MYQFCIDLAKMKMVRIIPEVTIALFQWTKAAH
ncbi:unnamed protein product [Strongylus vulgaris]|uniref:Uncharacterized protein n=1 Tax=Strongylus vulgaris TaxID=40348 RepID=A0A3P7IJG3_STRVU|nr:unnamed protein product [Strongylus vulgaris]